jgi:hypothetical protein
MHFPAFPFRADLIGSASSSIRGIQISPIVKRDTVRVGAVSSMQGDGVSPWIETVHSRGSSGEGGSPGVLVVVLQKDSALPINSSVRSEDEVVGCVVRIGSPESLEDDEALICLVVAVRIPQEEQIRPTGYEDSSVPKLKAEGVVHLGELDGPIGFAISVFIGEDKQDVVHFLQGFPLGIGLPSGGPEPSLCINLHLNRIDQLRKALLIREDVYFESLTHGNALHAFLGA